MFWALILISMFHLSLSFISYLSLITTSLYGSDLAVLALSISLRSYIKYDQGSEHSIASTDFYRQHLFKNENV